MYDLSLLPKIDLSKAKPSELSDIANTSSIGISDSRVFIHRLNRGESSFMVGFSEIYLEKDTFVFDFNPYSRTIIDSGQFKGVSDSDHGMLYDSVFSNFYSPELSGYDILFNLSEKEKLTDPVSINSVPVALISGHMGRLDALFHLQSIDLIEKNYRNVVDNLIVKNVPSSMVWEGVLSKAGINSKKRGYVFLKHLPNFRDENFRTYARKISSYARKHNIID